MARRGTVAPVRYGNYRSITPESRVRLSSFSVRCCSRRAAATRSRSRTEYRATVTVELQDQGRKDDLEVWIYMMLDVSHRETVELP